MNKEINLFWKQTICTCSIFCKSDNFMSNRPSLIKIPCQVPYPCWSALQCIHPATGHNCNIRFFKAIKYLPNFAITYL